MMSGSTISIWVIKLSKKMLSDVYILKLMLFELDFPFVCFLIEFK